MLNFEQLYEHVLVLEVKASKANIAQFKKKYGLGQDDTPMFGLGPGSDEAVAELINDFNKELKRGTMKQKDIFAFDSYNDFIQALDRAQSQQTKAELKKVEREGGTRVYEDEDLLIVHPQTHAASCAFGSGAKWCTASKDNPGYFKDYTEDKGVLLLYFLPKGKPSFTPQLPEMPKVEITDANIDRAIMLYPNIWKKDGMSTARAVGGMLEDAYGNEMKLNDKNEVIDVDGVVFDSLAEIAKRLPNETRAARNRMKGYMEQWNANGDKLVDHVIGYGENVDNPDNQMTFAAARAGFMTFLTLQWMNNMTLNNNRRGEGLEGINITQLGQPGSSSMGPNKYQTVTNMMIDALEPTPPLGMKPDEGRKYDKLAVAVYTGTKGRAGEAGANRSFGPYVAEAFDAEDNEIDISKVMQMANISDKDVDKISEYINKFTDEKVWNDVDTKGDKGLDSLIEYMEIESNQTPENFKRADEIFIKNPLGPKTWNYARTSRGEWNELEGQMLDRLDEIISKRELIKELEGLDFNELLKRGVPDVGKIKQEYMDRDEQIMSYFLRSAVSQQGLYGYYQDIKGLKWPEFEKRILDPKYAAAGLYRMIPDWVKNVKKERSPKAEEVLRDLFIQSNESEGASIRPSGEKRDATERYWDERGRRADLWYTGPVDEIVQVVRYLATTYINLQEDRVSSKWTMLQPGSTRQQPVDVLYKDYPEFRDAWWYDPKIVGKYWNDALVEDGNKFKTVHDKIPGRPFFSKDDLLPVGKTRSNMPSPFGKPLYPQATKDLKGTPPPSMDPK